MHWSAVFAKRMSVCPSVHLSHSWFMPESFKVSSYAMHHAIVWCLLQSINNLNVSVFSDDKNSNFSSDQKAGKHHKRSLYQTGLKWKLHVHIMPVTETIAGILLISVILLGRSFICCSNVVAGSVSHCVGLLALSRVWCGTTWGSSRTTCGTTVVGSTPITNNKVFISRKSRTQERSWKISQQCKNYTHSATMMHAVSVSLSWWNYVFCSNLEK